MQDTFKIPGSIPIINHTLTWRSAKTDPLYETQISLYNVTTPLTILHPSSHSSPYVTFSTRQSLLFLPIKANWYRMTRLECAASKYKDVRTPLFLNSVTPTPQLPIFCSVLVSSAPLRSAHENLHKNFGFPELRSSDQSGHRDWW